MPPLRPATQAPNRDAAEAGVASRSRAARRADGRRSRRSSDAPSSRVVHRCRDVDRRGLGRPQVERGEQPEDDRHPVESRRRRASGPPSIDQRRRRTVAGMRTTLRRRRPAVDPQLGKDLVAHADRQDVPGAVHGEAHPCVCGERAVASTVVGSPALRQRGCERTGDSCRDGLRLLPDQEQRRVPETGGCCRRDLAAATCTSSESAGHAAGHASAPTHGCD